MNRSAADLILTIDLGTTALKATLFHLDGTVVAAAQGRYPTRRPRPGWAEQDPADWIRAARASVRTAGEALAARGARLLAIGLTAQREGVVPVTARGRPLARCIIWMDRRAQAEADELSRAVPDLHHRTGLLPDASFTAARLIWLRRHRPEVVRAAAWWLQPRDYLYRWLTGRVVTDPTLASRTMLYDLATGRWAPDLLEAAGVEPDRLPPIHPPASAPGRLVPRAARALGLPSGTPVVVGAGDRACEVLGAAAAPGRPVDSTGTTTNIAVPEPLPSRVPDGVLVSQHAVPGMAVLEQGLTASGAILQWVEGMVASGGVGSEDEGVIGRARHSPPGARGLLLLPHFHGARAPWWNPRAQAVWSGFVLAHTADDMVRSVLEAVAFDARACLERLDALGLPSREVVLVGGGARSRVWAEIKANIWRRPVVVPRVTEAASLGAMLLAGIAVNALRADDAARLNPEAARLEPDPAATDVYDRRYEAYAAFYRLFNAPTT